MKQIYLCIAFVGTTLFSFSQKINLKETNASFSVGSKNAIVVTVPFGNKDIIEKEVKSLLKSWEGKYKDSKNEAQCIQGSLKSLGNKAFDAYIVTEDEKDAISIALAVDLGGAYLTSREHQSQYKEFEKVMKQLGKDCANRSVEKELEVAKEILEDLTDDQKKLEKDKSDLEKDIENYKAKIADAENKIKENEGKQDRKKTEIGTQTTIVKEVEQKMKAIQ